MKSVRPSSSIFTRYWVDPPLMNRALTPASLIISERKMAERELRAAERMWDRSFAAASTGIFIIDKDFTVIRSNPAVASILDKDPEEIIGRKCFEIVHGSNEPPSFCATCAALHQHRTARGEYWEPHLGKYLEVEVKDIGSADLGPTPDAGPKPDGSATPDGSTSPDAKATPDATATPDSAASKG